MSPRGARPVHLLDGNLLVALTDTAHVHHRIASARFAGHDAPFATCPITQGTLLRLQMHLGAARDIGEALAVLAALTAHPRHCFWPDNLSYAEVRMRGVHGHCQVTDAYLAALARHHGGRLATLDAGLAALHADAAVTVPLLPD